MFGVSFDLYKFIIIILLRFELVDILSKNNFDIGQVSRWQARPYMRAGPKTYVWNGFEYDWT